MMNVRLTHLYSERDLNDEEEALYHHISKDYADAEFAVAEIPHDQLFALLTRLGDMSVIEAFEDLADPDSLDIVKDKVQDFDADRIIVLCEQRVIDGNHHVAAAFQSGRGVRSIDLAHPIVPTSRLSI